MKVFVTGASGFVGGAATRRLVSLGHDVYAMSRSEGSDAKIKPLGATPVRCDLESIAPEHVGDAGVVLHCAAYVEAWGPPDAWYKGNVIGTRNVLAASKNAKRFIHIGTEAAIVHGQHIVDADETYPLAPNSPYPYCATKAQAEQLVRDAQGFETIILRPRFIWGPGDTTLLPVIVAMAKSGGWMWVGGGRARTSTTHIDNLVHAIVLALSEGRSGEAYFILDDGERTMKDMISGLAASRGVALAEKSVPSWLADAIGATLEGAWRTFKLKGAPPLTRHAAMVMGRDCVLNGAKARRELGYAPLVSVEEGLRTLTEA